MAHVLCHIQCSEPRNLTYVHIRRGEYEWNHRIYYCIFPYTCCMYVMLQVQSSCPVQELHTKAVLMGENCLIVVLILEGLATNLHTIVELIGYCRPWPTINCRRIHIWCEIGRVFINRTAHRMEKCRYYIYIYIYICTFMSWKVWIGVNMRALPGTWVDCSGSN